MSSSRIVPPPWLVRSEKAVMSVRALRSMVSSPSVKSRIVVGAVPGLEHEGVGARASSELVLAFGAPTRGTILCLPLYQFVSW